MRVLYKGNSNKKSLAYTSLVRPILEYGAVCWDPCREGQINALDRVQKAAAKFARGHNHRNGSDWESLAQRRKIARLCALQSVHRRTGMESYRGKATGTMLCEQG
jgi:hypothetical protein